MRISVWSSDVCASDLHVVVAVRLSDLRVSEHARVRLRHAGGVIAAILVDERVTLIAQLRNESLRARGSSSLRDGGFVQITDLSYICLGIAVLGNVGAILISILVDVGQSASTCGSLCHVRFVSRAILLHNRFHLRTGVGTRLRNG